MYWIIINRTLQTHCNIPFDHPGLAEIIKSCPADRNSVRYIARGASAPILLVKCIFIFRGNSLNKLKQLLTSHDLLFEWSFSITVCLASIKHLLTCKVKRV
jgi:hypothetical protein